MSEHGRYRQGLDRLGAADFAATVARMAAERGWVEDGATARRTFGRFEPGRSPWATMLYALGRIHVRVDAYDPRHGDGAVPPDAVADSSGPLRFTLVQDDGILTGLGPILAAHPEAVIVRYRPGQRAVLRVGDRFAKLVRPELGVRLHDAGRRLWSARAARRVPFRVAEPDRWDAETAALWQGVVAGEPVGAVLGTPRGRSVARLVGESLGALAAGPVEPWQQWTGSEQLARTERAAAAVVRRVPELGGDVADILVRLSALHDGFAPRPPVPVHGAASSDQWLDDGSTLGLVDFDRFSWSDPELDAAAFLAPLDFDSSLRGTTEHVESALIEGYHAAGFVPDPQRWATYRAEARLRKVARTAMAIRPDGDERAARHLVSVGEALREAERRAG